jgi:predicted secreted hydrolase
VRPGAVVLLCVLLHACAGPADEQRVRASLRVAELLGGADTAHARAIEVRPFTFPADHGPHPEFRTEWWYFTGNLVTADGRAFGYQLTFFRSALTDSTTFAAAGAPAAGIEAAGGNGEASAWRTRHAWMAHFAVSDIAAARIIPAERFARGASGLAGAVADPFLVWLGDWSAAGSAGATFPLRLAASSHGAAIELLLEQGKPVVLQGEAGLSRKGPEPGNASYYYSFTRMPTAGTVRIGNETYRVSGSSWLDREWSTSVLSPGVTGWDWMALQLDDGTDVMLYRLRQSDGTQAPFSAGTIVAADGSYASLAPGTFALTPLRTWRSPVDGTAWPTEWRVELPAHDMDLVVRAAFDAQELELAVRYWEGAVRVEGRRAGAAVRGSGYLEMTGWQETDGD